MRTFNKWQVVVVIPALVIVIAVLNAWESIVVLMGISIWTWWQTALAAWRADEPIDK